MFLPEGRGEGRRFLSEVNGVMGGVCDSGVLGGNFGWR